MPVGGLLLFAVGAADATDLDLALHGERLSGHGQFGECVAGTGDVDGDGLSDAIVGEGWASRAYVFYGSPDGLSGTSVSALSTPVEGATDFGVAVAGLGDTNGDGYADVAVGERANGGHGYAYVYTGGPEGIDPDDYSLISAQYQSSSWDWYGVSVEGGDLDGDGLADLIVGAPTYRNEAGEETGAAYVYYGSVSGIDQATEEALFQEPAEPKVFFGWDVAYAQDLDGDGLGEVVVGCPGTQSITGSTTTYYPCAGGYVYMGSEERGLDTAEPTVVHPSEVDWAELSEYNWYATSIDGAGDLDHDGYGDLVVGSHGTVYLYFGSTQGVTQESETRLRAGPMEGSPPQSGFGASVAGAGDIDGDGIDDLLVGSEQFGWTDYEELVFLFYGGEGSIDKDARIHFAPDDLSSGAAFGWSVAGTGDVTGDGYNDLLVGAPYTNDLAGAAWFISRVCDWYLDIDADGFGDGSEHLEACERPGDGWVDNGDDCAPDDPGIHPGATDSPSDGIDQDCDGADAEAQDTGATVRTQATDQGPALGELTGDTTACSCTSKGPAPARWAVLAAVLAAVLGLCRLPQWPGQGRPRSGARRAR